MTIVVKAGQVWCGTRSGKTKKVQKVRDNIVYYVWEDNRKWALDVNTFIADNYLVHAALKVSEHATTQQHTFVPEQPKVSIEANQGTQVTNMPRKADAVQMLKAAAACIGDRAASRDVEQERSMKATVEAFNAMFSKDLTEQEGWQFMVLLKMSRAKGGEFREDDFVDEAAYAALAGEANE